jgi:hypothetical protein
LCALRERRTASHRLGVAYARAAIGPAAADVSVRQATRLGAGSTPAAAARVATGTASSARCSGAAVRGRGTVERALPPIVAGAGVAIGSDVAMLGATCAASEKTKRERERPNNLEIAHVRT